MICPHRSIRFRIHTPASVVYDGKHPKIDITSEEVTVPTVDVFERLHAARFRADDRFSYFREGYKLLVGWRAWVQIHHYEYECDGHYGGAFRMLSKELFKEFPERVLVPGDPDRFELVPNLNHPYAMRDILVAQMACETLHPSNVFTDTIAQVEDEISKAILGQSVPKPERLEDKPPEKRVARCPACFVEVTHLEALGMARHECRLWSKK